ncbi:MAG: polysaccharide deacetylase family protein [Clostridia bacterium]|nr:polysaccharide deacetylase family protein [Clostridia bacterium]
MKKKTIGWIAGGILALAVLIIGGLSLYKGYFILYPTVKLTLNGEETIEAAAHSEYTDPGATAVRGSEDLGAYITVDGEVDSATPGTYTLTYRLSWKGKEYSVERTVTVKDLTAPDLELLGEKEITVGKRELFTEPGFTALDLCDGDLTEKVTVSETLAAEDTLRLTYTVTDLAGNTATAVRTVYIRDVVPPTLKLKGYSTVYVALGSDYREPGYKAEDDTDGDLSGAVQRSGSVDTGKAGTYTLNYLVRDKAGNSATAQRQVKVYAELGTSADRVYLTFDDGPSSNITPRILDTLKANDVQATFFIVNYSSSNKYLIQRMINEGHTVAIHGYSHDYAAIYANDDAFMNNIYRLRDKLLADFGYNATIIRFPGGSSNTVSANYNAGIMSRLVERVEQEGFTYFDWNVSSGDASGGSVSKSSIYRNVTSRLSRGRNNVVLMHDAAAKSTTADALQDIIDYGKGNGYCFLPITPDTYAVHHGVNN